MSATLYRADGTSEDITPKNGVHFTIEELHRVLNCRTVELIRTGDPNMIMLGDEESRLRDDYSINIEATRIFRDSAGIVNPWEHFKQVMANAPPNVIFCGDDDEEPYTIAADVIYCPSVMFR